LGTFTSKALQLIDETAYMLKLCPALFVNLNGPDISQFNPLPFVKSWLVGGGKLSTSWKPGAASNTAQDVQKTYTTGSYD